MIIAGVIVFSILWCFIRCLCCGAECACCCFRCCASCCGSGRNKGHKHLDSAPPTPYHQQQYQSPPHPVYGAGGSAFSQTATFDASHGKPIHEDSLPAMPSWENAPSKKVEVWEEAESHEMDRLKGNESPALPGFAADPQRPGMAMRNGSGNTVTTAGPPSPRLPDPYGYNASETDLHGHGDSHTGYRGAAPVPAPVPAQMSGYSNSSGTLPGQGGYRNRSPVNNGYGADTNPYGGSANPYGGGTNPYSGGGGGGGVQRNDYGDNYSSSRLPPSRSPAPRSPVYAPYQGGGGGNNQSSGNVGYGGRQSPYGNYGGQSGGGGRDRRPAPQGSWRDI